MATIQLHVCGIADAAEQLPFKAMAAKRFCQFRERCAFLAPDTT